MKDATPKAIYLKDYTPPAYWIERVDLHFELGEDQTRVRSRLELRRNAASAAASTLVLNGEQLQLAALRLDGGDLGDDGFECTDNELRIRQVPDAFVLEIETLIKPQQNTSLEGLYRSSGNFCTQCEAEGFRKITYYLDRPDVMAMFTTTIVADRTKYPVLLSNGNPAESGELADGRHWVKWVDPFRKPSYLFALVAGDLACVEDSYTTLSGRRVRLRIYVQHHNVDQCEHAMRSLIKSMQWDEQTWGREYDLDVYNIVAVDDFNMGAMENKGLNVFNSRYVLARQETATDVDYINIEGVIGHEYFHNWSGNRVTCRDWFQLTLKEGLTVFRDQQFTADMNAATPKRIDDVNILRTSQFAEDAGPMAHPIQPASYLEINNFYTVTVYNKGAEVIRMIHTLTGQTGFRRGLDLYFERHDGQAVTTEDFVRAMEDANAIDLAQFRNWYTQAGTPVVSVREEYSAAQKKYVLELSQSTPPTPGQEAKKPFQIPVAVSLMDGRGNDMPVSLRVADGVESTRHVLDFNEPVQRFEFDNVSEKPVLSLLRGYSAPVKIEFDRGDDELAFCMAHDSDEFNRWDAGQQLATRIILRLVDAIRQRQTMQLPAAFVEACRKTLHDEVLDKALAARALTLPSLSYVSEHMQVIDIAALHQAREFVSGHLAVQLQADWLDAYRNNSAERFELSPSAMARRFLKNLALSYLLQNREAEHIRLALRQFHSADNMTDQLAAFRALVNNDTRERQPVIDSFYRQWRHDHLVIDKWFSIQAMAVLDDTVDRVEQLFHHPDFDLNNPNRVRALLGAFCSANPVCFHDPCGRGYTLLCRYVEKLDSTNPQIASRLLSPMTRWKRYDETSQAMMRAELERLMALPNLSRDVYELVSKSLQ